MNNDNSIYPPDSLYPTEEDINPFEFIPKLSPIPIDKDLDYTYIDSFMLHVVNRWKHNKLKQNSKNKS